MEKICRPHSTRLFPQGNGADSYNIKGIASRCDYVFLTDRRKPHFRLHKNRGVENPRHVFLSMRALGRSLKHFIEEFLPSTEEPFVLVSGSEDATIPNQVDTRWSPFGESEKQMVKEIKNHPNVLHWFAENLDDNSDPIFSPLPTGFVFKNGYPREVNVQNYTLLEERPTKALCAHRIRKQSWFDTRRNVSRLAKSNWSEWCTALDEEVSLKKYESIIQSHAFVLCVHGGGLDPSPKAWRAVYNGAIPIIRDSALREAYEEFPAVFVDDWSEESLSLEKLHHYHEKFSELYKDPSFKEDTLRKLSMDFWWDKISSRYEAHTA